MKNILLGALALAMLCSPAQAWERKTAPIMTEWAEQVDPANPLPEYPRPQLVRAEWLNLNGIWEFDGTVGLTNRVSSSVWKGIDEAVFKAVKPGTRLPREILVPFPVESALSGVMERMEYLKYRRTFKVPAAWKGRRVRLNFDAVDWRCEVWVNGRSVGEHRGGYDAFSFDITPALKDGENELIVSVWDPTDNGNQPVGKQRNQPEGYWYTPNSGIWQTVWLEPVHEGAAQQVKIVPHWREKWVGVTVQAKEIWQTVTATAFDGARAVGTGTGVANREFRLDLAGDVKAWTPDTPFLYDLKIQLFDKGRLIDDVASYFGLRDLGMAEIGGAVRPTVNGEFIYQLGTLDQGYWPDGNLRAPTDEALKSDIVMHKKLGFNMIRKHIKVEPARWFYWCDKLGILVWQDMPSMHTHAHLKKYHGGEHDQGFRPQAADKEQYERELKAMVDQHVSSPAVVGWILFNEGWGIYERVEVKRLSDWLSAYDPSRWVNDSTGLPNEHASGDAYDIHIYPGPSASPMPTQVGGAALPPTFQVLGEFGGAGLNVKEHTWFPRGGWAYGEANKDQLALQARYEAMQDELYNLMFFPGLSASMYTQITDVEGETNGLLTYDRKVLKFDAARLAAKHARILEGARRLNAGAFAPTASVVAFELELNGDAEAGLAVRKSAEGQYTLGVKADGTLFIRGEGAVFGGKGPYAEKKVARTGTFACKVTAFGSSLGITVNGVTLALNDPFLPMGALAWHAKDGKAAFRQQGTVAPHPVADMRAVRRVRWMHGPVKFLVTRNEKVETTDADGRKVRREEVRVISDCNAKEMGDAYWELEPGLADGKGISFRSMSMPGSYLTLTPDGFVNVVANDGTPDFAQKATWYTRAGLERADLVSFESAAMPGKYMGLKGRLSLRTPGKDCSRYDATFELVD